MTLWHRVISSHNSLGVSVNALLERIQSYATDELVTIVLRHKFHQLSLGIVLRHTNGKTCQTVKYGGLSDEPILSSEEQKTSKDPVSIHTIPSSD